MEARRGNLKPRRRFCLRGITRRPSAAAKSRRASAASMGGGGAIAAVAVFVVISIIVAAFLLGGPRATEAQETYASDKSFGGRAARRANARPPVGGDELAQTSFKSLDREHEDLDRRFSGLEGALQAHGEHERRLVEVYSAQAPPGHPDVGPLWAAHEAQHLALQTDLAKLRKRLHIHIAEEDVRMFHFGAAIGEKGD